MEPEIDLERFAALCAEVEAGMPLDEVLRGEGLSAQTWSQSRDAWMGRMSGEAEATRNALEARYKAAFEARSRVIEARASATPAPANEDEPTPPRAQSMAAIGLMDTVPMLPTADPEQLLARLRARRAEAAKAAQEGGATPPPPVVTRGPGAGLKVPPPPPARESKPVAAARPAPAPAPAPIPPMRAPTGTLPDSPPARPLPGSSRPTLPFQALPAPLPPPAALPPPSPPQAAKPAPAALPPPPPPQAAKPAPAKPVAPPPPPGFGGYPPPPLPGAPPSAPSSGATPGSSPGFPRPTPDAMPPTVPAPMTLAGFPTMASGPRLSLERYAAFAAEIAVNPVALAEIRTKYGMTDAAHTAETEAWQRRFSADRETYVRYATLYQHYRDWFAARGSGGR